MIQKNKIKSSFFDAKVFTADELLFGHHAS